MVRLLIDPRDDDRVEAHARWLLHESLKKSKNPIGIPASRALVPEWCSSCDERCWGVEGSFYSYCDKCKGEGKIPVGFGH
jgi:hypothetical protein